MTVDARGADSEPVCTPSAAAEAAGIFIIHFFGLGGY